MGVRTVIGFALALVTFALAAPNYAGEDVLEDKRLYLKGQQKKKAIWKGTNDGSLSSWYRPEYNVQERWPTQKPWSNNYWEQRLLDAQSRVYRGLEIAARQNTQPQRHFRTAITPEKKIVPQVFDFPVGSRSRRSKRDLMDVNGGSPLTAVYKDNVIAEFEHYGSEDKVKSDNNNIPNDMTENVNPDDSNNKSDIKEDNMKENLTLIDNAENITKTPEMTEMNLDKTNQSDNRIKNEELPQFFIETVPTTTNTTTTTTTEGSMNMNNMTMSSSTSAPSIESVVSTSKGFRLCSEDGLSCSRTPISAQPKVQVNEATDTPLTTLKDNMDSSSSKTVMNMSNPFQTTEDPLSTMPPNMDGMTTPIREEYIEKIPLDNVQYNLKSVPVVVFQPVEMSTTTDVETTTANEPEENMKAVPEQGRSFDNTPAVEANIIPVQSNQEEDNTSVITTSNENITKSPELNTSPEDVATSTTTTMAPSSKPSTPATKISDQTKDESVMEKVANWFENAWDSVKNWF